jgi:hypothetical protein
MKHSKGVSSVPPSPLAAELYFCFSRQIEVFQLVSPTSHLSQSLEIKMKHKTASVLENISQFDLII